MKARPPGSSHVQADPAKVPHDGGVNLGGAGGCFSLEYSTFVPCFTIDLFSNCSFTSRIPPGLFC